MSKVLLTAHHPNPTFLQKVITDIFCGKNVFTLTGQSLKMVFLYFTYIPCFIPTTCLVDHFPCQSFKVHLFLSICYIAVYSMVSIINNAAMNSRRYLCKCLGNGFHSEVPGPPATILPGNVLGMQIPRSPALLLTQKLTRLLARLSSLQFNRPSSDSYA